MVIFFLFDFTFINFGSHHFCCCPWLLVSCIPFIHHFCITYTLHTINMPFCGCVKCCQISVDHCLPLQSSFRDLPFKGWLCFASEIWWNWMISVCLSTWYAIYPQLMQKQYWNILIGKIHHRDTETYMKINSWVYFSKLKWWYSNWTSQLLKCNLILSL